MEETGLAFKMTKGIYINWAKNKEHMNRNNNNTVKIST